MKAAPQAAPQARRQRPGSSLSRGPPGRTPGRTLAESADQDRSSARTSVQRKGPSSSPPSVQLAATASRAPYGRRQRRSAKPTLDPATTHKDSAPTRKTGKEQDGLCCDGSIPRSAGLSPGTWPRMVPASCVGRGRVHFFESMGVHNCAGSVPVTRAGRLGARLSGGRPVENVSSSFGGNHLSPHV